MKISAKIYSAALFNIILFGSFEGRAYEITVTCPKANDYTYNSPNWSAPSSNPSMIYSFFISNAPKSIKLIEPIEAQVQKRTSSFHVSCIYSGNPTKHSRVITHYIAEGWIVPNVASCKVKNKTTISCEE